MKSKGFSVQATRVLFHNSMLQVPERTTTLQPHNGCYADLALQILGPTRRQMLGSLHLLLSTALYSSIHQQ